MDTPYILTTKKKPGAEEYMWPFVYLHGNAENVLEHDEDLAPDMFYANEPKPKVAGQYICTIGELWAVAVIAPHLGILGGRIALVKDPDALKHALTPEKWA